MNKTRRSLLASVLAAGFTLVLTVGTALAAELMGTIKSVDIDGKKIAVTEKDTDKDVDVTVTDDTEWVTKKKSGKIDLAKVKKGTIVEVIHEDAKASKITVKKGAPKKDAELNSARRAADPLAKSPGPDGRRLTWPVRTVIFGAS